MLFAEVARRWRRWWRPSQRRAVGRKRNCCTASFRWSGSQVRSGRRGGHRLRLQRRSAGRDDEPVLQRPGAGRLPADHARTTRATSTSRSSVSSTRPATASTSRDSIRSTSAPPPAAPPRWAFTSRNRACGKTRSAAAGRSGTTSSRRHSRLSHAWPMSAKTISCSPSTTCGPRSSAWRPTRRHTTCTSSSLELEQALVSGGLAGGRGAGGVERTVTRSLGLKVPDYARGRLQDIHWSGGGIGYFPTYALGNLYAATGAQARHDLGDLDGDFRRGEFGRLKGWLNEKVHRPGQRLPGGRVVRAGNGQTAGPGAAAVLSAPQVRPPGTASDGALFSEGTAMKTLDPVDRRQDEATPGGGEALKVLIVDDEAAYAETVQDALERIGNDCTVATSGKAGCAASRRTTSTLSSPTCTWATWTAWKCCGRPSRSSRTPRSWSSPATRRQDRCRGHAAGSRQLSDQVRRLAELRPSSARRSRSCA